MLLTPLVVVNFKTYAQATGEGALKLARAIKEIASARGVNVAIAPQHVDLSPISRAVKIPMLAQHVDAISPGSHTGWLLPEAAKAAGAVGSLVNHSERPLATEEIQKTIERLRELGMVSIVCARDVETSKLVAAFKPDAVAVEPPELIGTGRAVSKVSPEVVSGAVEAVRRVEPEVRVLCGAGISSGEDVRRALELGAEGVLLASYVVCARDQRAAMLDIVEGVLAAG